MQDLLAGLRILDCTTAVAMPTAMHLMSDMGAEIIKVESHTLNRDEMGPYVDNVPGEESWNNDATFHSLHRGKRSLTLNFKAPESIKVFKELIKVTDVMVENNRAGTMDRLGLGYQELKKENPALIYFSNTGFGHTGPWKRYAGIGSMLELICGLTQFTGYADGTHHRVGAAWFDIHVAWMAIFAILSALEYRDETGKGQWVDFAMYQIGVATIGDAILDYTVNGRNPKVMGNRHNTHAPHGTYPCKGDDKWVVFSIENEQQWNSLRQVMGHPSWSDDPKYSDPLSRFHHQDEMDKVLGEWTRGFEYNQLMQTLQENGVPAAAVMNTRELMTDPHMVARDFYERFRHSSESGIGTRAYVSRPWKMSKTPAFIHGSAPALGEANEYVMDELLGWSEEDIARLYEMDVMAKEPANQSTRKPMDLEGQLQKGIFAEIDPDYKKHLGYE